MKAPLPKASEGNGFKTGPLRDKFSCCNMGSCDDTKHQDTTEPWEGITQEEVGGTYSNFETPISSKQSQAAIDRSKFGDGM